MFFGSWETGDGWKCWGVSRVRGSILVWQLQFLEQSVTETKIIEIEAGHRPLRKDTSILTKFCFEPTFWKIKLQLTKTWYVIDMIATQVTAVAVKNMAPIKILIKTSFMFVMFSPSETVLLGRYATRALITYWPPIIDRPAILSIANKPYLHLQMQPYGYTNLQCH